MKEEWKNIEGYEGLYQVSSKARVKSLERKSKHHKGGISILKERILKNTLSVFGYCVVTLCDKTKRKTFKVHRLFAKQFIPNPYNKPCINHIDGDKANNSTQNLEWCTYSENNYHAYRTKLRIPSFGSNSGMAKLNEKKVLLIKKSHKEGVSNQIIGDKYHVSRRAISSIINGETWKHVK